MPYGRVTRGEKRYALLLLNRNIRTWKFHLESQALVHISGGLPTDGLWVVIEWEKILAKPLLIGKNYVKPA